MAAVLGRFGRDERIVGWDLFNEPDSPNPAYATREARRKTRRIADLLELVFDWAVAADPDQPLTAGVYLAPEHNPASSSPAARTMLERSDVVSFHSYAAREGLKATIETLARIGRPLWCTEWLARPTSPAELLDVLVDRTAGAFNWGLVDGRTQTRLPWTSWVRAPKPDRPWFHELL
ncbi:MAG: 1,4-beta-xylanase, partial [Actinomycetota bacterium]